MSSDRAAVLNYHRVVPDGSRSRFYDVERSTFEAQMRLLADRATRVSDSAIELSSGHTTYVTFDDGTDDHHWAGQLLAGLGLPGVFFLVSAELDVPGRLTTQQVEELVTSGHRIGSHTITHARLPEATDEVLEKELIESRHQLEDITGTTVDWFAPPGGLFDDRVLTAVAAAGYRLARTMEWGYAPLPLSGRIPTLPVLPSYDLDGFSRLLDGRAPLWRYHLKTGIKRTLGESRYVKLRDTAYAALRRRGG